MKLPPRILRILPIVLLTASGLVVLLQTLAYLISYESPKANYFAVGSLLPMLSAVLTFIICAAGAVLTFLIPKNQLTVREIPIKWASLPAAAGFLAGAVILALSVSSTLSRVTIILLLLGAGYAICAAFLPVRYQSVTALVGFGAVLGCILLDALYYFDTSLEMNAPVKVTVLVGVLCTMLYHTGEIRFLIDKPAPRLFLMLGSWVLGSGALCALPVPIAAIAGQFNRTTSPAGASLLGAHLYHPEYLAGSLIVLGTAVSAGIRLWFLLRPNNSGLPHAEPDQTDQPPQEDVT